MIWAGISHRGKTPLVFVDNTIDALGYVQMLKTVLEPFITECYPRGATFQQDGTPAHRAQYTRDYFVDSGICDLPWPPVRRT